MALTVGSLFSGIGGIDLACEWAGMEVIWQCEIDPFCQQVLKKHWPEVKLYDDIHAINKHNTIRPDILVFGDPCQPYSVAGERAGQEDDRYLWPEAKRVMEEIRPRWVVRENVVGNITLGIDQTLSDMENIGYTCWTIVLPACAVKAEHRRDRVFIIANNGSKRIQGSSKRKVRWQPEVQGGENGRRFENLKRRSDIPAPQLCGTYHGIPDGVDRIRALGNAVVPQQIYPIIQAIADIERGVDHGKNFST